jgi:hypothetical protein
MPRFASALCALFAAALFTLPAAAQPANDGPYADFVPGANGEPFTTWGDAPPATALVARIFALSFAEPCEQGIWGDSEMRTPQVYDFSYREPWDEADAPDESLRLYRFFCGSGAYNVQSVYMTWVADTGLRALSFAQPSFEATYVDPDNFDGAVSAIALTGQSATSFLVNSAVDPATGTISAQSCWRGLCDASSIGVWVLEGAEYRLQRFLVDPTYDGEMNHISLVDYTEPLQLPLDIVPTPDLPMPEEF